MDLSEFYNGNTIRHPWETARLKALAAILRPHLFEQIKVLDIGCGDGFISTGLFSHLQAKIFSYLHTPARKGYEKYDLRGWESYDAVCWL